MKISSIKNLKTETAYRPDLYIVESPRGVVTAIDYAENFVDLFPKTALKYSEGEAEDLVKFLKEQFPDYKDDPYYGQGIPIYPIFQPPNALGEVEKKTYKTGLTAYRYKQAGEWIYGITNKWTDDTDNLRAIEAPMDGWDKWLSDRKQMVNDKWLADNGCNL